MLEILIKTKVKAHFVTQDVELVPQMKRQKAGKIYELLWYGY